jgi:hypothetical protein
MTTHYLPDRCFLTRDDTRINPVQRLRGWICALPISMRYTGLIRVSLRVSEW